MNHVSLRSRWVCEEHPNLACPHEDCVGPRGPCPDPRCPYWQQSDVLALNPHVRFDTLYTSTHQPKPPRES
jgi:hypothetical protein